MVVPLRKKGNPIIQGVDGVEWDGSQCILMSDRAAINVPQGHTAVVLVVSFRKE